MKLKKVNFNFLNKLEDKAFSEKAGKTAAVSAATVQFALLAAVVGVIGMFLMQMFGVEGDTGIVVLGIVLAVVLGWCGYMAYKQLSCFSSTGVKVGFMAYTLALACVSFILFFWLAMWALFIALVLVVGYFILKFTIGDAGNSRRVKVRFDDGTEKEMTETKGICGESYYE